MPASLGVVQEKGVKFGDAGTRMPNSHLPTTRLQSNPSVGVVLPILLKANLFPTHISEETMFLVLPQFQFGFVVFIGFQKKENSSCADLASRTQLSGGCSSPQWFAFVQIFMRPQLFQDLNHLDALT